MQKTKASGGAASLPRRFGPTAPARTVIQLHFHFEAPRQDRTCSILELIRSDASLSRPSGGRSRALLRESLISYFSS